MQIIYSILILLVVILIHEFGHFIAAKLTGIKVLEFSVGMGPKVYYKTEGETLYTLRLLPIGGYVRLAGGVGEEEESDDPRAFNNASIFARIITISAGALMNFIFAILIFSIYSYTIGQPINIIGDLVPGGPAYEAGLKPGDEIIEIEGDKINSWDGLANKVSSTRENQEISIKVIRKDEHLSFKVLTVNSNNKTVIGVQPSFKKSADGMFINGWKQTVKLVEVLLGFLGNVFTGKIGLKAFSGPVGVVKEIGSAAKKGWGELLFFLGFINVNLGLFNLVPLPALDGGRLSFMIIELIRGRKVSPKIEAMVHTMGMVFLLIIMLIVTYKDILRAVYE